METDLLTLSSSPHLLNPLLRAFLVPWCLGGEYFYFFNELRPLGPSVAIPGQKSAHPGLLQIWHTGKVFMFFLPREA
jgi:hypothetical protein